MSRRRDFVIAEGPTHNQMTFAPIVSHSSLDSKLLDEQVCRLLTDHQGSIVRVSAKIICWNAQVGQLETFDSIYTHIPVHDAALLAWNHLSSSQQKTHAEPGLFSVLCEVPDYVTSLTRSPGSSAQPPHHLLSYIERMEYHPAQAPTLSG